MPVTTAGRVTFSTSLQPSWPSKSSSVSGQPWSIEPIAPSAITTRSARAARSEDGGGKGSDGGGWGDLVLSILGQGPDDPADLYPGCRPGGGGHVGWRSSPGLRRL